MQKGFLPEARLVTSLAATGQLDTAAVVTHERGR